jgi:hypothetical protein
MLAFSFLLPITALADQPKFKLAILPYVAPTNGDIQAAVNAIGPVKKEAYIESFQTGIENKFAERFNSNNYELVPPNQIKAALSKYGYDVSTLDFPDKNDFISIANELNVDGVVGLEITQFKITYGLIRINITYRLRSFNVKTNNYSSLLINYTSDEFRVSPLNSDKAIRERLTKNVSLALDEGLSKLSF